MLKFENSYAKLPDRFFQRINPETFQRPSLLHFNTPLAQELGIDLEGVSDKDLANIFAGQVILEGSEPLAQAYAGFQFGHPVPQLGDGRAHVLGEVAGHDIQLKGSGRTRFSRQGDGRSALGPVIREYIVSEAMHALGVPTTRALAAVRTGESVLRQYGEEPGGIFTRVANSLVRVGTFQYFAFQNDLDAIGTLLDYTLQRHYPELTSITSVSDRCVAFLKALIHKQADLIAQWSSLGFVHGVMNTDNFSVAGITIDYGPCAFLDEFKFDKVFSSIDQHGRYSFFNQVPIAQWNIYRLAEVFIPLIDSDKERAIEKLNEELAFQDELFSRRRMEELARKLGIEAYKSEDESLVIKFLEYLEDNELDFTLSFYHLPEFFHGDSAHFPPSAKRDDFLARWQERVQSVDHLPQVNPRYIPRNHQVERAIQSSYRGDDSAFHELVEVLKKPFERQIELDQYAVPPKADERVLQTFCGT